MRYIEYYTLENTLTSSESIHLRWRLFGHRVTRTRRGGRTERWF